MPASPPVAPQLVVSTPVPQAVPDGTEQRSRGDRYGNAFVRSLVPTKHVLAQQGSYWTSSMLPQATVLQLGLSAAFSALAPAILITNTGQQGDSQAKRTFLDYIRFVVSVAPTSGTSLWYASVTDSKDRTPSTISNGSGGSGPGTPATATAYRSPIVCTNQDLSPTLVSACYFPLSTAAGAPPAAPAAGPNARTIVGNGLLRAQIPVALDTVTIQFGAVDLPGQSLVTAAPAGASRIVEPHPAVVLGPGEWYLLYLWAPSNATAGLAFSGLEVGGWDE